MSLEVFEVNIIPVLTFDLYEGVYSDNRVSNPPGISSVRYHELISWSAVL